MIAVITGDIVASRKLTNQDAWLHPLKNLLSRWGDTPQQWIIERGDFFQLEINNPEEALQKLFIIKALIKKVVIEDKNQKRTSVDIRMALGIGEKTYTGENISESNGTAFINSGEKLDALKKGNIKTGIKSPWQKFDEEMNLYLKLTGVFMDSWSVSSAELIEIVLQNPDATQEEIGNWLGIKQNSVSGRWNRARAAELLEVEKMYRKKLKSFLSI